MLDIREVGTEAVQLIFMQHELIHQTTLFDLVSPLKDQPGSCLQELDFFTKKILETTIVLQRCVVFLVSLMIQKTVIIFAMVHASPLSLKF